MYFSRFANIKNKPAYHVAISLGVIVGGLVYAWINDNAGLRPGNGTSEWARYLAKFCVAAVFMTLVPWAFCKVTEKWYERREKSSE